MTPRSRSAFAANLCTRVLLQDLLGTEHRPSLSRSPCLPSRFFDQLRRRTCSARAGEAIPARKRRQAIDESSLCELTHTRSMAPKLSAVLRRPVVPLSATDDVTTGTELTCDLEARPVEGRLDETFLRTVAQKILQACDLSFWLVRYGYRFVPPGPETTFPAVNSGYLASRVRHEVLHELLELERALRTQEEMNVIGKRGVSDDHHARAILSPGDHSLERGIDSSRRAQEQSTLNGLARGLDQSACKTTSYRASHVRRRRGQAPLPCRRNSGPCSAASSFRYLGA